MRTLNVNFPIVLLGAIGAGACCNISPAYPLAETATRLQTINADFVFFGPEHRELVTAAAKVAGVSTERLFILDGFDADQAKSDGNGLVAHWSSLLDFVEGPAFEWKRLSEEEARMTTALLCHTSGYVSFD